MVLKNFWTGLLTGALTLPIFSSLESRAVETPKVISSEELRPIPDESLSSNKCTRNLIPNLSWIKKPIYESREVPLYRDRDVVTSYRQICSGINFTTPGLLCPPKTISILQPTWIPETTRVRKQIGTTKVYEFKGYENRVNLCPEQLKTNCCTSCHK